MYFDEQAATWDTKRRVLRAQKIAAEIQAQARGNTTALEYGCGTGLISFLLKDYFKEIVLMDAAKEMIKQTAHKIEASRIKNLTVMQCDLTAESFEGKRFDFIFSSMALHHVADVNLVIHRLCALLDEGGRLCIVDLDTDDGTFHALEPEFCGHDGFSHDEITDCFVSAGLSDIRVGTFLKDEKMIGEKPVSYSLFCACGSKKSGIN